MKLWNTFGACMLALSLGLMCASAIADDDCDVPVARWQSREAVSQMATQKGWDVQRLKIDDGCYEVRGRDAKGRSFKAKIDPETLKIVKIKYGDWDRDRSRDGERRRDVQPSSRMKPDPSEGNVQFSEVAMPTLGAISHLCLARRRAARSNDFNQENIDDESPAYRVARGHYIRHPRPRSEPRGYRVHDAEELWW